MKLRNSIISLLAIAAVVPAYGKTRTDADIMQEASRVLIKSAPGSMHAPMRKESLKVLESNEAFSVVGFDGGSYAIIANDDLLPAVLGYSATPFNESSDNPGFQWWVRNIKAAAASITAAGEQSEITTPDPDRFPLEVPQMMSNVWGQMEPFNNLCPLEYDANGRLVGRTVVGCVATSATQVMHYHQYPPQGEGVHVDTQTTDAHGNIIPLKVDFADYKFEYDKMLDSYSPGNYTEEQANAVASLAYPVGVSFGMIYGTGASGTYSDSAIVSLRKHLKFPNAERMDRFVNNEKTWMETIYNELSHNRPVLYSGADNIMVVGGGGHAFVFDGYNSDGLVHVNWGWYGRNDGYYRVDLLNPRIHSFVNQQDMIIGVAPPDVTEAPAETFTGRLTAADLHNIVVRSMTEGLRDIDLSAAELDNDILPAKAFYGSHLRRIVLPNSLRRIEAGAFGNCRYLNEVVFPEADAAQEFIVEDNIVYSRDGETVIAVMPYYYNYEPVITDYISMLRFRDGVKYIGAYAADGCFRVQGVEIPATVERIGTYAFANTPTMKVVKVLAMTPANMAARAFPTLDAGFTKLMIPAGTADTYVRAGEWVRFFAFENVYEYGTNVRARNIVRWVGEPNPELTYQIFGEYVPGEPELSCAATIDSPVGEYPIIVSMGTLTGDDIILTNGILRVINDDFGSVEDIEAAGPRSTYTVYTVDGRCVLSGAESIDGLDRGFYIINGKKVIIK